MHTRRPIHGFVFFGARGSAILGALFAVTAPLFAAAGAGTAPVSFTATGTVASDYSFRGLRMSGATLQPAIEAQAGDLLLGAWANLPLRGERRDRPGAELELFGSYDMRLSDAFSWAPGFMVYHFPDASRSAGFRRTTFEPSLAFHYTGSGFRITPRAHYDTAMKGPTLELAGIYAHPLKRWGSELDFTAALGTYRWSRYRRGVAGDAKAWGDYWTLGVALPFQIAREARVTLSLAYSEGRNAFLKRGAAPKVTNPLAEGQASVAFSYAYSF